MGQTYWYAYDKSGEASGPYYHTRDEADAACDDDEVPRPVSGDVVDIDADSGDSGDASESESESENDAGDALDDLSHDELKAEAEDRGIADDIDLRSKESIRDALRDT